MTRLYEPTSINGMTLSNRLVRSATWEGMSDPDGRPLRQLADLYRGLAEGGIGLLVTGYAYVRSDGQGMPYQMGIHRDDFEADYRSLVSAVHSAGGKIAIQLGHVGGQGSSAVCGFTPIAPSSLRHDLFPETPTEMTSDDIRAIIEAFRDGARRAVAWGFDAIQLHGAHGYIFSQFLSPLFNRRCDEYGGSLENRSRFLLEVYQAIRQAVGLHYPVMIKLGIADFLDGGLEIAEGLAVARKLAEVGMDAIEVSAGTMASGEKNPCREQIGGEDKQGYYLHLARLVKQRVRCPVIAVGGFRTPDVAETAVAGDGVDYVALSRPLIREPDLPKRWREGDCVPATCISCNGCFPPGLEGNGIRCVVDGVHV